MRYIVSRIGAPRRVGRESKVMSRRALSLVRVRPSRPATLRAKRGKMEDVAVIGAGPAGLGAAIGARRAGARRVVVFEKQEKPGLIRKGEVVRRCEALEASLARGIYERHSTNTVRRSRFHSASERRSFARANPHPEHVITFTPFIAEIAEIARREGVRIETGAAVRDLRVEGGVCRGFTVSRENTSEEVRAHTVIGAGGSLCPSAALSAVDRSGLDCPILKMEYGGVDIPDESRLELFTDALPGAPPGAGFIFPRGGGEAEVGYVVFADCMTKGTAPEPGPVMERLFDDFLARHPLFSRIIEGGERSFITHHYIPMGAMAGNEVPRPGLLAVGDRAGHITAGGGSGVNASLRMGLTVGGIAGELAASGRAWTPETAKKVARRIERDKLRRKLALEFRVVRPFRKIAFNLLGAPGRMDRAWPLLSLGIRLI